LTDTSKVCKLLKQFIDCSAKLRYIVEAHARGLEPLRNAGSAQLVISQLFAREQSWAMFGSIPGTHIILNPPADIDDDNDEGPLPIESTVYDSGRMFVCRGSRVSVNSLSSGDDMVRNFVVPGLRNAVHDGVVAFGDWIAFSTPE
jgi:hypothetical protein